MVCRFDRIRQRRNGQSRWAYRRREETMMEPRVLVAYATRSGTTAELASTMAEVLRQHGVRPEVYSRMSSPGWSLTTRWCWWRRSILDGCTGMRGTFSRDIGTGWKRYPWRSSRPAPWTTRKPPGLVRAANWRRSWRVCHGFPRWRRTSSAECSTRTGSDFLTR